MKKERHQKKRGAIKVMGNNKKQQRDREKIQQ
jgi:hypothetical protein